MKRRTRIVAVRLMPKEWEWIEARRREDETYSDVLRRLALATRVEVLATHVERE